MAKIDKLPSQRQLRAANLIKIAIIEVLRNGKGLDHKLIESNVTVTEVMVSPDLQVATCYVLPYSASATKITEAELIESLNSCKASIRLMVTNKINLRYSPELRFIYDYRFEQLYTIDKLIKQNNKSKE